MADALSPEDLQRLVDLVPQLTCVATVEGYFEWLSDAWSDTLGWSLKTLKEVALLDLVHPDDQPTTLQALDQLAAGEAVQHFTNRLQDVNGNWVWLDWVAHGTRDGRLFCSARDVTARKRMEADQQRYLEQLRQAERLSRVAHWTIDLTTQTVTWSDAMFLHYGRDPELGPMSFDESVAACVAADRSRMTDTVEAALASLEPFEFEVRVRRDDGSERTLRTGGDVELDTRGDPIGLFGVTVDVTESRRNAERLRHVERLASIGTLATGVAHEINNPLTYVSFHAHTLAEELTDTAVLPSPDRMHELGRLARETRGGVRRIERVVRALRSFADPTAEEEQPIDLAAAAATARRITEGEWRYRARVDIDMPEGALRVPGNESRVVQMLMHLIVNAAHAMPDGRPHEHRIRLTAGRRGDNGLWLEINDDGAGMAPDVLERAAEPFFTTRTAGEGAGLGLFLVGTTAQAMGGTVQIRSTPELGTTVRLELPEAVVARRPAPAPQVEEEEDSRARIVIIDDDAPVARSFARILHRHDCRVFTSPSEALAHLGESPPPDLILCDLMIPEMPGSEVYEHLPPALRDRTWFVTGGGVTATTRKFQADMSARVLLKPIDRQELRNLAEDRLQQRLHDPRR